MHRKDAERSPLSYLGTNIVLLAAVLFVSCKQSQPGMQLTFPFLKTYSAAPAVKTNLVDMQKDDGQWVMPAKNYQSTRFSALNQIPQNAMPNLGITPADSRDLARWQEDLRRREPLPRQASTRA